MPRPTQARPTQLCPTQPRLFQQQLVLWCSLTAIAIFVATVTNARSAELTPEALSEHLKTLLAVEPLGKDQAEAAQAWVAVAESPAEHLTTVLAALDDASPLAANWIRTAVDAASERLLDAGEELPANDLEQFVLDTKHAPRARRLAFELLSRADTTAPDRLVPGFLDDPSIELRRDAVARLMEEAEKHKSNAQSDPKSADAARDVYRKAFSGARDRDQIEQIAAALEQLGHSVNMVEHFGFIVDWQLIGPFDNTSERGYQAVYPPETEIDLAARYEGKPADAKPLAVGWVKHATQEKYGTVDLNQALGKANGAVAYAMTDFEAEKEQKVEFRITSSNAIRLWLNGQLIEEREVYHSGSALDQYVSRGTLRAGRNVILLKVCQNEQTETWAQSWGFQLRVCDAAGTAVRSADIPAREP